MNKKEGKSMKKITLGLSVHRPEMIPIIADWMRQHDAIFLEEPLVEDFEKMLVGSMTVDDYLRSTDLEYVGFSRKMCFLLRDLKAEGKTIVQVEPFLEKLLEIHRFFAEGHQPEELNPESTLYPVYLAERDATGALLAYYQTVMNGSFENILETVKQFARLDAARFRLRDSLRAEELARMAKNFPSAYIEAGAIHFSLWQQLRRYIGPCDQLRVKFLADASLKKIGKTGHLYGPGDQLTMLYIFHPSMKHHDRESILAARSLIYSKLITKEEILKDPMDMPHTRDELLCIQIVSRLSLDDCRVLFPMVRNVGTKQSYQIVKEYLSD
jgi:hypothetical protein